MTKIHRGNEALELLKKIRINRGRSGRGLRNLRVSNWLSQVVALKMGELLEITDCCDWEPRSNSLACNDVQYLRQKLFSPGLKGQFTTTHSQKICAVWRIKPEPTKVEDEIDWSQVLTDGGTLTLNEASDD